MTNWCQRHWLGTWMSAFSFGSGAFLNCPRNKVEPEVAHSSHQSASRGYRERNRGRIPLLSAVFLKCLSMLGLSPAHHGHQQIMSTLQLLCPTLHTKTLLPCLLQGHSQRLKLPKQFWISGYNQPLASFSSATILCSWDHKGNRENLICSWPRWESWHCNDLKKYQMLYNIIKHK